jgi:hypothetical protein
MKISESHSIAVDMVPLIDIISLLLMFLIIVGDTTASSNIASLKLPVASEAQSENSMHCYGRIVIQLKPEFSDEKEQLAKNGRYSAIFNAASHSTGDDGKSLKDHLAKYIDDAAAHGMAKKKPDGTWDIPVKLRIPAMCPMVEAERLLFTVASLNMSDIQYAAAAVSETK